MKNATNRYQLFPAETLKGVWGSCGSHHNTSGLAADNRLPPPSQRRARRVGGKPNVVFSESWALQLGTPSARTSGEIPPSGCCIWGVESPSLSGVVDIMWAEHNQIWDSPSLSYKCWPHHQTVPSEVGLKGRQAHH